MLDFPPMMIPIASLQMHEEAVQVLLYSFGRLIVGLQELHVACLLFMEEKAAERHPESRGSDKDNTVIKIITLCLWLTG